MNELNKPQSEQLVGAQGAIEALKGFWRKQPRPLQILMIGGILLLIFLLINGRSEKRHKKDMSTQSMEKREVFKERDVKDSLRNADTRKRDSQRISQKPQKRNYDTDIAVFVFTKKDSKESHNIQTRVNTKKLGLPSGTKIDCLISGSIFSFNVAAPVVAIVARDIEKDGVVIIPKNSKFLGEAGVLKSLNRINVRFDRLIFSDGREVRVRAMALSSDGSAGIKGKVNKHKDLKIFKAMGESLLAGASLFAGGMRSEGYALQDQIRLNVAQGLTQEARQDLQSVKVDTSITVGSYTAVEVILLEAI